MRLRKKPERNWPKYVATYPTEYGDRPPREVRQDTSTLYAVLMAGGDEVSPRIATKVNVAAGGFVVARPSEIPYEGDDFDRVAFFDHPDRYCGTLVYETSRYVLAQANGLTVTIG